VTLVYCGQTVGRMKMKLGTQVGLRPGHIALDRDPMQWSPSTKGRSPPIFGPYICCGQVARCIKMSLGTKVGLGPGCIVLHGDPAPLGKGAQPLPNILPMSVMAKRSPISATADYLFKRSIDLHVMKRSEKILCMCIPRL